MFKHLFFDDQKLFDRFNVKRCVKEPELVEVFNDGITETPILGPWVFRLDNGKYRMMYQGYFDLADFKDNESGEIVLQENGIFFKEEGWEDRKASDFTDKQHYLFSAISDDGIHFVPEDVSALVDLPERVLPHQVKKLFGGEIGWMFEDPYADPSERYKFLYARYDLEEGCTIHDEVYVSPDLLNWTNLGVHFHNGWTEPCWCVFYNKHKKCHTILSRPHAGVRRYGYIETTDWRNFTPHTMCMQVDSMDPPRAELYGLGAIEYDGWYIGMPLIYDNLKHGLFSKGDGGTLEVQLAYSLDGCHWQRSLRDPFLRGDNPAEVEKLGYKNSMVWLPDFQEDENGDLIVYADATRLEHGAAFHVKGGNNSSINIYKMRRDGFICLETENKDEESCIATRENIWHGGDLHINIKAEKATVAIYEADGVWLENINGDCKPVAGYGHEDCIPFSGDNTDWVPTFKNGKSINDFAGKVVVIEVKFMNGELYSLYGECTPVMNVEAGYYRKFGTLPEKSQYGVL